MKNILIKIVYLYSSEDEFARDSESKEPYRDICKDAYTCLRIF